MDTIRSRMIRFAGGMAICALAACADPGDEAATSGARGEASADTTAVPSASSGTATESSAAPSDSSDPCLERGDWQPCSVEKRLERAGLVIQRSDDPVRHDFLHVPGVKYETSRAEIQVFLYPSSAARARDTDAMDTVAVAPRGRRIIWRWPATLVTSGNLAAIILSLNERQAERIALALGAGLPPAPPR